MNRHSVPQSSPPFGEGTRGEGEEANCLIVGLSHKSAPLRVRERLAFPSNQTGSLLKKLARNGVIQESMLLSTCNRLEAVVVAENVEEGERRVQAVLSEESGLSEKELLPYLYVRKGEEAFAHLFRVAASLDSMVIGETQITGQVKEAYQEAAKHQTIGPCLKRLVPEALRVTKKIRRETMIGEYPVSVSSLAVILATQVFGSLAEKRGLILGAGEMGELAGRHLREKKISRIFVANRHLERANEVAALFGGEPLVWEKRGEFLKEADIVIASAQADQFLIRKEEVEEAITLRKGRGMLFIDLGVPRNLDPEIRKLPNVYLYDLDALQGIVGENQAHREREAKKAEQIIQREVVLFQNRLDERGALPTIRELSEKFEEIRSQETGRLFSREKGLTPEQKQRVEACTRSIVTKILHEPILTMKTEENSHSKYSEILRRLFNLGNSS